jgi:FG-GAP repeat
MTLRPGPTALLLLIGCSGCGSSTGLNISFSLNEQLFPNTAKARIIVSKSDHGSFSPAMAMPAPGLSVSNYDYDGDGGRDVVVEYSLEYPLRPGVNRFRLVPASLSEPIDVQVRVEALDGVQNVLAHLKEKGPMDEAVDYVSTQLAPGALTGPDHVLEMVCVAHSCATSTVDLSSSLTFPAPGAISALAAGNILGDLKKRNELLIGSATAAHDGLPAAGVVRAVISLSSSTPKTVDLLGEGAGDLAGSAMAVADLDGDLRDDLVIGAPGFDKGRGRVYIVYSGADTWIQTKPIPLGAPPAGIRVDHITGSAYGDLLGSTVALADVDADGRPEILAGAPGRSRAAPPGDAGLGGGDDAGAVYALWRIDFAGTVPDGGATDGGVPSREPALIGRPGGRLGQAMAALAGHVLIGAPTEPAMSAGRGGAVYLVEASDLAKPQDAMSLGRWRGAGGAFGSAVALLDAEEGTPPWLLAGAPGDGAGAVYILTGTAKLSGDVTAANHAVAASGSIRLLGASLARLSQGNRRDAVIGAPYQSSGAAPAPMDMGVGDGGSPADMAGGDGGVASLGPTAGSLFLLRSSTITLTTVLRLQEDGSPAAARSFGQTPGDAYGAAIAIGDFDEDGRSDLAVGAQFGARVTVYTNLP